MLLPSTAGAAAGQAAATASAVTQSTSAENTPELTLSGEYPAPHASPVFATQVADMIVKPGSAYEVNLPMADGFVYCEEIPLGKDLQQYTYNRCVEKGLEYELILALMWRESRFQVDAVGHNTNGTQDSGIMQINDVNREWLRDQHGIVDLMDPIQNIDAGTIILSNFTGKYGVHDGLMAYQYGETGMREKFSQGVYTNDKIALLMDKRNDFRAILQQA